MQSTDSVVLKRLPTFVMAVVSENVMDIALDQSVPQWKRELILKKRAMSRSASGTNISAVKSPVSESAGGIPCTLPLTGEDNKPCCTIASSRASVNSAANTRGAAIADGIAAFRVTGDAQTGEPSTRQAVNRCDISELNVVKKSRSGLGMRLDSDYICSEDGNSSATSGSRIVNFQGKLSDLNSSVGDSVKLLTIGMGEEKRQVATGEKSELHCVTKGKTGGTKPCRFITTGTVLHSPTYSTYSDGNFQYGKVTDSETNEELEYGPGIVNKLKSKYLSMAMSTVTQTRRNSLRRTASLEDWLDKDGHEFETENITNSYFIPTRVVSPDSLTRHKHDSLKKTLSVGTLSLESKRALSTSDLSMNFDPKPKSPTLLSPKLETAMNTPLVAPLVNEDIVIIETTKPVESEKSDPEKTVSVPRGPVQKRPSTSTLFGVEDDELPPPDTVKQTLKIFEPITRKSVNKKIGTASKVANYRNQVQKNYANQRIGLQKSLIEDRHRVGKPASAKTTRKSSLTPEGSPKTSPVKTMASYTKTFPSPSRITLSPTKTASFPSKTPSPPPKVVSPTKGALPLSSNARDHTRLSPTRNQKTSPSRNKPSLNTLHSRQVKPALPPRIRQTETILTNGDLNKKPVVNGDSKSHWNENRKFEQEEGTRSVTLDVIENIRKGGTSLAFSFQKNNANNEIKSHLPKTSNRESSVNSTGQNCTEKTYLPKNDSDKTEIPKQVGVIRPMTIREKEFPKPHSVKDREKEKNLINKAKSDAPLKLSTKAVEKPDLRLNGSISVKEDPIVLNNVVQDEKSVIVSKGEKPAPVLVNKSFGLRDSRWHQQQNNTLVFNFSGRKDVPDHVENDGLNLAKRARPKGNESGFVIIPRSGDSNESSDFTDEEEWTNSIIGRPPSPCTVLFEGSNVIINGRSSMKKGPKDKKLNISFNDEALTLYEYPSEVSVHDELGPPLNDSSINDSSAISEETGESGANVLQNPPPAVKSNSNMGQLGGFGSYTPSKIQLSESPFELGVSRPIPQIQPNTPSQKTDETLEEYLKPAEDDQTVSWSTGSTETTSDLLF